MANPTTAKPSGNLAEWLSTASTPGANMLMWDPMLASGCARDVVGNVLGGPATGVANSGSSAPSGGFGHPPAVIAGAFTFGGLSDPVYRFGCGTTAVRYPSRGFTSNATPRTFIAVVRPVYGGGPQVRTVPFGGTGSDTNFHGMAFQISTAGVITVGTYYASTFSSSGVTLTSGKTYLISITYTSNTACSINVYCYDDQAWVTSSSTSTTFAVPSTTVVSNAKDAVLNPYAGYDGYLTVGFVGDVYAWGLSNDSYDLGAGNGYFAALIADPNAAARGSYTGTGTLTAGGISGWDSTKTAITVHSNRPTGGVAGDQTRYQYRLHRSTTASFTPSSATQVTGLQSSPVLVDTTAVAGVKYYYKVEQTDGVSTVYSTTATTNRTQAKASLSRGDFFPALGTDSRGSTVGYGFGVAMMRTMRARGWRCGFIGMGLGGTSVYNSAVVSLSWQPSTTGPFSDPTNGQAGTVLLANLLTAAVQAGCNYVYSQLGVNDSGNNTPAVFAAKYAVFKAAVLNAGLTLLVDAPYQAGSPTGETEAACANVQLYQAQLAALDNGTTCRYLGTGCYDVSMSSDGLERDDLHNDDAGLMGVAAGAAILAVIDPTPITGAGRARLNAGG